MKLVINGLGIVAILLGLVWIGQGTDILKFGGMAGHAQWTYIGGMLALIGVVLLVLANRNRAKA